MNSGEGHRNRNTLKRLHIQDQGISGKHKAFKQLHDQFALLSVLLNLSLPIESLKHQLMTGEQRLFEILDRCLGEQHL
jgi:hypothetical protein